MGEKTSKIRIQQRKLPTQMTTLSVLYDKDEEISKGCWKLKALTIGAR